MNVQEAIMAFSQSEKIKVGLIWTCQAIELLHSLSQTEKQGGERMIVALVDMVAHEVQLARNVAGYESWEDVDKCIEKALVMINSHAPHESVSHLAQALSLVTSVGQRSMTLLRREGLV